eukprot:TRINITY_DN24867_c0_g1_i1.p1 TRINITY_DN24867_c0_g1~~TRINITY_DN24867_c0_g1_i1.p1  ORF type:complete len:628 (+),score=75.65 TRINITY_DN24867_c0_g1_i1:164-2047(+)
MGSFPARVLRQRYHVDQSGKEEDGSIFQNSLTRGPSIMDLYRYEEVEGEGAAAVDGSEIPLYWTNKQKTAHQRMATFEQMIYVNHNLQPIFDSVVQGCQRRLCTHNGGCPKPKSRRPQTHGGCHYVRPAETPMSPEAYRVRRVIRVEDSAMWARYLSARRVIKDRHAKANIVENIPDPPINTGRFCSKYPVAFAPCDGLPQEAYLFHGTSVWSALSIARDDFQIDPTRTPSVGRLDGGEGYGIHLSESYTGADEYAVSPTGGFYDGVYAILLCRVCLGNVFCTEKDSSQVEVDEVLSAGYDSTCNFPLPHEEHFRNFVVYDRDAVYAEYIVLYERLYRDMLAREVGMSAAPPIKLHTELPVYWKNVAMNPRIETFDGKYVVRSSTHANLQRLVAATCSTNTPLLKAWRVENSETWNQYTDFKEKLRSELRADIDEADEGMTSEFLLRKCATLAEIDDTGNVLTQTILEIVGGEHVEEEISIENLDDTLNEVFLWHGTTKEAARAIAKNNFHVSAPRHSINGQRFGCGVYLAESLDKALAYARASENLRKYVLLCRVCLGKIYFTKAGCALTAHLQAAEAQKHSVVANPCKNRKREFVALSASQVYPEFILKLDVDPNSEASRTVVST